MIFDSFKISGDGSFTDTEGRYWDNKEDYLGHLLGFCGCGCPDDALRFVGDVLELIGDRFEKESFVDDSAKMFCDNTGLEYLVYYLLDNRGLIEHGGSVPGWLTDYGKDFLKEIKAVIKKQDKR